MQYRQATSRRPWAILTKFSVTEGFLISLNVKKLLFLPRYAMHKRGLCRHAVSICLSIRLSVCLTRSWIMSKRINVSSKFFHHSKWGGDILTGTPVMGATNARVVWKNDDFRPTSCFISKMLQHSYHRRRIGNRVQAFEWYHFEWSWVTSNPDFKVTISFKYVRILSHKVHTW